MPRPVIVTCGEPAGIGPELAPLLLAAGVPMVWLGDPRHLPQGCDWVEVTDLDHLPDGVLPVLRHDFAGPSSPGRPDPANAQGVIARNGAAIDRLARLSAIRFEAAPAGAAMQIGHVF